MRARSSTAGALARFGPGSRRALYGRRARRRRHRGALRSAERRSRRRAQAPRGDHRQRRRRGQHPGAAHARIARAWSRRSRRWPTARCGASWRWHRTIHRAIVGRAVVALEHGDIPNIELPQVRLGVTTEAWFHLARGLAAISRGKGNDSATALSELDLARRGIVHEGRLGAALCARAFAARPGGRGRAGDARRRATRPERRRRRRSRRRGRLGQRLRRQVASALSVGPQTPRRLAVYGRALELVGKHKRRSAPSIPRCRGARATRRPSPTALFARAHLGEGAAAVRELEKAANQLNSPTPHYGARPSGL